MPFVILAITILLAVGAQFLPLLVSETWRPYLQGFAGLSAFFLGMSQGAFGNYLADLWTDRRHSAEQKSVQQKLVEKKNERFLPFLQAIRNAMGSDKEQDGNDLDIVISEGNITFAGGKFHRIIAGGDFDTFKSMAKRLESTSDLQVSRNEQNWIRLSLEDDLYEEILKLSPNGG